MTTGLVLIGVTGDAVVAGEVDRSGLSCSCPLDSGDGGGVDRPSDGATSAGVTRLVDGSARAALVSGIRRDGDVSVSGSGGGGDDDGGDLGGIVGGNNGGRICS